MGGIHENMSQEEALDKFFHGISDYEAPTLGQALINYDANDEARICPHTKNGTCFKGPNCKLEHTTLREDGITTDKEFIYTTAFEKLPLPNVGDEINIIINYVNKINDFYATLQSYDPKGKRLRQLTEIINKPKTVASLKTYNTLPTVGELVIAKHWDEKWYRGRVQEVDSDINVADNIIKVFFVDFGEVMDVLLQNIRKMEELYLDLPFQAIRCKLSNIKPKKDVNKNDSREAFESKHLYKLRKAHVKYVGADFLEVLVFDSDNQDIGKELIDDGFAEENNNYFFPKSTEILLVD